jgi:lysyl endopeptidase
MPGNLNSNVVTILWLLLTIISIPSHAQPSESITGRVESFTQPANDDVSPLKSRRVSISPPPHSISIGAISKEKKSAEIDADWHPGTPRKIGFSREVPQLKSITDTATQLTWQNTTQGGKIVAISINSPQATGIRLGILVRRLPVAATFRFYSQGTEVAYETTGKEIMESIQRNVDAGDNSDAAHTYWSPHIEGEEVTMEIELPAGINPDTVEIAIPSISHFFFNILLTAPGEKTSKIGQAASCQVDVSCFSEWSPESKATAKLIFVDSGTSYLCSGTMLNDVSSSGTPYFLSANHCITNQTIASTLQTFWFYRSTACNSGSLNSGFQTRTGGATLLYGNQATDTSFMQLSSQPPTGAVYAGWSSITPELNAYVASIHHPRGDLQKISSGIFQSFQDCTAIDPVTDTYQCTFANKDNGKFLDVAYTSGITEGGSSGAGLFEAINNAHYLVGQLRGGNPSCFGTGSDEYGRFDVAYNNALYQWLNAGPTFLLSVSKLNNGNGTVISSPNGINCGTRCSAPFTQGSNITLTATPASGSIFSGWGGACSGANTTCSVAMNSPKSVTATFSPVLPPGTIVEYYNPDLDHYFITAGSGEQAFVDSGAVGRWQRTGITFMSGGNVPICRFYGSVSPGPNSHFYTADADECAQLKQLQATTPATQKRWNFESLDFLTTLPINGICPANTSPIYRAYNNGFSKGIDSNHRITNDQSAIQAVVARGWINENVVMCAPQ